MRRVLPCAVGATIDIQKSDLRAVGINSGEIIALVSHPNPEFYKAERMGFWTGNIPRTMSAADWDQNMIRLPRGVWERLCEAMSKLGVEVHVETNRVTQVNRDAFSGELPFTPGSDQEEAVEALIRNKQGVVCAPCSAGKTYISYLGIKRLKQRSLIMVHTEALLKQWIKDLESWLPHAKIGQLYGKAKKAENKYDVVVAMQQTLKGWLERNPGWGDGFGIFVQDEVHHAPATTFLNIPAKLGARYRWGLTATPTRKDGKHPLLFDTFGPIRYTITDEDLDRSGRIVPVDVYVTPTDFAFDLDSLAKGAEQRPGHSHNDMLMAMGRDAERNKILSTIILREADAGRTQLILGDRKEALEAFQQKTCCGRMFGGPENRKEMEAAIEGLEDGTMWAAVGTTVADEGLNIKRLATIILSTPTASNAGRLTQQIGRVKRLHPTKKEARAWYLWDRNIVQLRYHVHKIVAAIKAPHRLWYVPDPEKLENRIPLTRELAHKLAPKE